MPTSSLGSRTHPLSDWDSHELNLGARSREFAVVGSIEGEKLRRRIPGVADQPTVLGGIRLEDVSIEVEALCSWIVRCDADGDWVVGWSQVSKVVDRKEHDNLPWYGPYRISVFQGPISLPS